MTLYTRKGDKGDTSFFGSKIRFPKDSLRVEALGAVDEVNSLIGFCKTKAAKEKMKEVADALDRVQNDLFVVQAEIASYYAPKGIPVKKLPVSRVEDMEKLVDGVESKLPPIKNFTVAGGTELSALIDYARTVARRTERIVVALNKKEKVREESLKYLNRLSSLLFALARFINHKHGIKEKAPKY